MPRTLTLLIGAGVVAGSILPVSADRGRPAPSGPRLAAAWRVGPSPAQARGPQEAAVPVEPASALLLVDRSVLLVVGNATTLGVGDAAVKTRLEGLGFIVTAATPAAVTSDDAYSHHLVIISSTVTPGSSINTKFRDVQVPVVTWESGIFGHMKLTGTTSGTHFGTDASETKVTISTAAHPLAAGLTGGPTVTTSAQTYSWGAPGAAAAKAATIFGVPGRAAVFGYEPAATMVGTLNGQPFVAPARRVGFFLGDTFATTLNANGWALFDAAVLWASNKVGPVSYSPWSNGNVFSAPVSVEMTCDTPGTEIRYTTDGSDPTTSSTLYTGPVNLSTTTILRARAFLPTWVPSDASFDQYIFSYGTLADPVITPNGGSGVDSLVVTLSAEPGATIHYTTTDGWVDENSPIYSGPLTLMSTVEWFGARAFRPDYTPSQTVWAAFQVRPPAPTIDLPSGTYPLGQTTTVTAPPGATLHYSISGDEPTQNDPVVASGGSIPVGNFTLKVNAWRPGQSPSASAQATYTATGTVNTGGIAAGPLNSIVLRPDGTVAQWGSGVGPTAKLVAGLSSVKQVSAGAFGFFAVRTDGSVWKWTPGVAPAPVSGLANIASVSAGREHALAIDAGGTLWAWGDNAFGQLGNGTTNPSATPLPVVGLSNIVSFSAGKSHNLVVTADGFAWAWGSNEGLKLGDGTFETQLSPVPVRSALGDPYGELASASAGGMHSIARTIYGGLQSWGDNDYNQLGQGLPWNQLPYSQYPSVVNVAGVVRHSAGYAHTLVATSEGRIRSWGRNNYGQVGDGTTTDRYQPTQLGPANVIDVAASTGTDQYLPYAHSLALSADGTVWAWGHNAYGQLGDGTLTQRNTPVAVYQIPLTSSVVPPVLTPPPGDYETTVTVTMTSEPGTVIRYEYGGATPTLASPVYSAPIQVYSTDTVVKAIAVNAGGQMSSVTTGEYDLHIATPQVSQAGGTFPGSGVPVTITCATPGATIRYTWNGADPQPSDLAIPSGASLTLVSSGTLKLRAFRTAMGPSAVTSETYTIQGTPVAGSLAAGYTHSLLKTGTGALLGWGNNGSGEVGDGTQVDRWSPVPISAVSSANRLAGGGSHTLALDGGLVRAWGYNYQGQLGDGSSEPRSLTAVQAAGLTTATRVYAGNSHSLAVLGDGTVRAWGENAHGQLGDGTLVERRTPVPVSGLVGVTITDISAGYVHSLALDNLGRVWAWGANSNGQLGDGTSTPRTAPVLLTGFGGETVARIAAGSNHSLAVTATGRVYAWGANWQGQLGDGTTTQRLVPTLVPVLENVVAIGGGFSHTVALRATGDAWAWGAGGVVGDGTTTQRTAPVMVVGLGGIVEIAIGGNHSLARTHDGSVWAWGLNESGQLGDGSGVHRLSPVRIADAGYNWHVATPSFNPPNTGGTHVADLVVTVTCLTPGATIRYTTTGADPTEGDAVVPSGGTVVLGQSSTLKARAWKPGAPPSGVAASTYTLVAPQPVLSLQFPTPVFGSQITATNTHPTVTMHYRADGNVPTESDPVWPAGGLVLQDNMSLRVRAFKAGWTPSTVAQGNFVVQAPPPTFDLASGSYTGVQTVALSTPVPDGHIHYTTNGRLPTVSDPFVLNGGTILVDRSLTLMARVSRPEWATGLLASADYLVTLPPVDAPVFAPPAGTYSGPQNVTITSSAGATIRYTVDGSEPTTRSPEYTGPIAVDYPLTLRARAFHADHEPTATASAAYAIALTTVAPPAFDVPGGVYVHRQLVRASTATLGAVIRYRTDGIDPTSADPTFPSAGLEIAGTLQVKARAFRYDLPDSPVRSASYWITGMVDAGYPSMAVRPDGTLWAWGDNSSYQLGDGTLQPRTSPFRVGGPFSNPVWRSVSAGLYHTLALDADGRVWAWGNNGSGRLGDGTGTSRPTPILVSGLDDVVAVSAGEEHSLALKADGTVWAWGENGNGELGLGHPTDVSTPVQVPGLTGIAQIDASDGFSLALKTDGAAYGTLLGWGEAARGQFGDGTAANQLSSLPARLRPSVLLTGVLGATAGRTHVLAWKPDGSWWRWGTTTLSPWTVSPVPQQVPSAQSVAAAAGDGFSLSVTPTATVDGWGANNHGQLGRGTVNSYSAALAAVTGLSDVVAVSADYNHALALRRDGSVMSWGYNGNGQVGIGSTVSPQPLPMLVSFGAPLASDPDGDGLPTALEGPSGCNPYDPDTNRDGLLDGAAIAAGLSCSDLDMDDDGLTNLVERQRGLDPFRPDTDDDASNDSADCFPLDPTRWECLPPDPNDNTPPVITLTSPTNATLISSVP